MNTRCSRRSTPIKRSQPPDLDFSRGPRGIEIRLRWPNGFGHDDLKRLDETREKYPDFSLAFVGDEAIFRRK